MVEINSWKFTQLIIHTINMKRKWLQEKEFLLSSPTNEWKNFHFWDSHFHINWFIRRHLFAISFCLFTAHLFRLFPFVLFLGYDLGKGKMKIEKAEKWGKGRTLRWQIESFFIFYYFMHACLNEEFFIILIKMLNFSLSYDKRIFSGQRLL